jgi:hypothetical protein
LQMDFVKLTFDNLLLQKRFCESALMYILFN